MEQRAAFARRQGVSASTLSDEILLGQEFSRYPWRIVSSFRSHVWRVKHSQYSTKDLKSSYSLLIMSKPQTNNK